jgi:FkbM family methyltransferase
MKNWTSAVPFVPDVFIDIGVGYNNSEAWIARKAWPDVKIIGAEPAPNRYRNCKDTFPGELIQCCIGSKDGTFEIQPVKDMVVMFPRDNQKAADTIEVPMRSLDSLNEQLGPWKNVFIWSDTEGAEMEVLKGAKNLLDSGEIMGFNLELWSKSQSKGWTTEEEVLSFLEPYGYKVDTVWSHGIARLFCDFILIKK